MSNPIISACEYVLLSAPPGTEICQREIELIHGDPLQGVAFHMKWTFDLGKETITPTRRNCRLDRRVPVATGGKQVTVFDSLCRCLAKGLPSPGF
jgi:hypothetical protein